MFEYVHNGIDKIIQNVAFGMFFISIECLYDAAAILPTYLVNTFHKRWISTANNYPPDKILEPLIIIYKYLYNNKCICLSSFGECPDNVCILIFQANNFLFYNTSFNVGNNLNFVISKLLTETFIFLFSNQSL